MIVVEERLNDVFSQLPEIDGFKPVFDWGNQYNLMAVLKSYADAKESPYPLIYQDITESEENQFSRGDGEVELNLKLIIACSNPATELLNKNRWAMSYRNVLFPVVENIEKCFYKAGIFTWTGEYGLKKHPNYGNGEENFTTDIWDALVLRVSNMKIDTNCIQQINF